MVQQHTEQQNALHQLGYKIFLDRYALKDMKRETLQTGDTVIVVVDANTGQREVGTVKEMNLPEITVELLDGEVVKRDIENIDKPLETLPEQMMERVAKGVAAVEATPELQAEWQKKFRKLLDGWKFVPGGRILTAAGTDQELTFYNCYVIASPKDSREGIIKTLGQMTEIMSRGGGVGINISTLRPRQAYVKGVNGRSSGSVSWGALYSFVTGLIEQGGCFGPDERIATDYGLITASDLADLFEAGVAVQAQTHKGLRPITARFRNGVKPLFEVSTKRGYKVCITEDHKVAVLMDGQITTMPLKYLQEGDEVLLLLGQPAEGTQVSLAPVDYDRSVMSTTLNTDVTLPTTLDEDLAYWLGYAHGDGYVHVGKKVNWQAPKAIKLATADAHPAIRDRLIDITRCLFSLEPVLENGGGAVMNLSIYSRMLMEWLIQNDLLKAKSDAVRVPEKIFRAPSSVQLAFIAGYFDADGCDRGRKGGYGFDSISREMLEDVQTLLAANGIVSKLSTQERNGSWRDLHRLSVTGGSFKRRFAENIPACKAAEAGGAKRDMYLTYPANVWKSLGARSKYRQRIYDGVSERISYGQLQRIRERLVADEQHETAEAIDDICNTMPDVIESITPIGDSEVFDFEVDDVHLLSGNGIYTSNSRRGALMLILNDWHPDVFDFINSKREMGRITNANISVGVSDKLMEAVKADADWELKFPDTSDPDYDDMWDGDIDTWEASGRNVVHFKTVKAREVWRAIIESAWASAEPGVWFRERSNKMANSWYFNPLIATNPCITGDTRIFTSKGMIPAQELFDDETEFDAVIDGRFGLENHTTPATRVFMTGHKEVFHLQTKEGYSIRATADHRFMTPRGWVELQNLKPGDEVHILNRKGGFGAEGSLELGRTLGWLVGDGTIKADRAALSFFGDEKRELAPVFAQYVTDLVEPMTARNRTYSVGVVDVGDRDEARVQSERLRAMLADYGLVENKHQVPEIVFRGTEDMQRGFLQALFTADGSIQCNIGKGVSVRLASSTLDVLEGVQTLLSNFGIASQIYKNRRQAQMKDMPDGKGGYKSYHVKAQHELIVSKSNLTVFAEEVGFVLSRKQEQLEAHLASYAKGPYSESFTAKVESITSEGIEPVYDLTEPITSSFIANGLVIHNCGEQPLGAFSVCNLGAINLSKFYDERTDDVKWNDLGETVQYATRFLDNVIDTTPYFFPENREIQQEGERRVGLGTMGIAELMVKLGIRYGSDESVAFIDKLYGFITREAYRTSAHLAAEKGAFPRFEAEKFLESGFMQGMDEEIQQLVGEKGIRNVTLLTQAPTGTTGTMVNTSTGIEPFFSWVYYRKSRLGLHEEQVPLVQDYYAQNPGEKELPDYFITAMDLSPDEHVKVQGAFQRWIDSAISKTCNVPNEYTVDQVADLYMYMYELGCKGGTIYRDGSRNEQVLMLKDESADEQEEPTTSSASEPRTIEPKKTQVATPHRVYPRPKMLNGNTLKTHTPFGTAYITMNQDENGHPFEVFITSPGKAGSDLQADAEGLGRMISLALRTTAPQNRKEMLKLIIEQLRGIGGTRSIGFGPQRVTSLPDAVSRALEETFFPQIEEQQLALPLMTEMANPVVSEEDSALAGADMCPSCGTISLIRAEGCRKCMTCGYSEC